MKIGVLALHGAVIEHIQLLRAIGVEPVPVRLPEDLEGISGLILPGGESTTMRKLVARWGLREPIMALARSGAPILGTCAGMIIVAMEIAGGDEPVFPLLDVTVERNAFGRQLDSFETDLAMQLGAEGVFVGSGIFKSENPKKTAEAIVQATLHFDNPRIIAEVSKGLGSPMRGIATGTIPEAERLAVRGW